MTQQTSHTPGPWHCDQHIDDTVSVAYDGVHPPVEIARIEPGREMVANARLIAAAPALLETLRLLLRRVEMREYRYPSSAEDLAEIRAAIALATPDKDGTP